MSLVILGCTKRKTRTSRLVPAVERYEGPAFQVFRKYARERSTSCDATVWVLSARFGLISGDRIIPRYDRKLKSVRVQALCARVRNQLELALRQFSPERVFVSVGRAYMPVIAEPLRHKLRGHGRVFMARGGIGGRASQLARWLRRGRRPKARAWAEPGGEASLLGTTVRLSRGDVIAAAEEALMRSPRDATRFETWYVPVSDERVAPKWLVSLIFHKPVGRFRTADARRVLKQLGVKCAYANRS